MLGYSQYVKVCCLKINHHHPQQQQPQLHLNSITPLFWFAHKCYKNNITKFERNNYAQYHLIHSTICIIYKALWVRELCQYHNYWIAYQQLSYNVSISKKILLHKNVMNILHPHNLSARIAIGLVTSSTLLNIKWIFISVYRLFPQLRNIFYIRIEIIIHFPCS